MYYKHVRRRLQAFTGKIVKFNIIIATARIHKIVSTMTPAPFERVIIYSDSSVVFFLT